MLCLFRSLAAGLSSVFPCGFGLTRFQKHPTTTCYPSVAFLTQVMNRPVLAFALQELIRQAGHAVTNSLTLPCPATEDRCSVLCTPSAAEACAPCPSFTCPDITCAEPAAIAAAVWQAGGEWSWQVWFGSHGLATLAGSLATQLSCCRRQRDRNDEADGRPWARSGRGRLVGP